MSVFKDKWSGYTGDTWRVVCYYTDWRGEKVRHEKRGFETKREAVEYEHIFLAKKTKDINMDFGSFIDIYINDMIPQIKKSTLANKINIINKHIRPYFAKLTLSEITPTHILQWQNELLAKRDADGKGYTETYLRTINNQLTALFNHAVKYYDLPKNPCYSQKKMGKPNMEMELKIRHENMLFPLPITGWESQRKQLLKMKKIELQKLGMALKLGNMVASLVPYDGGSDDPEDIRRDMEMQNVLDTAGVIFGGTLGILLVMSEISEARRAQQERYAESLQVQEKQHSNQQSDDDDEDEGQGFAMIM